MKLLSQTIAVLSVLTLQATYTVASDVLTNNGFTICLDDSDIQVQKLNMEFNRASKVMVFDVAGSSAKSQNVTATVAINAYGQMFDYDFDPCTDASNVEQLCPIPSGTFSAKGEQKIPQEYVDKIPPIAFAIPDLDAIATLKLKTKDGSKELACIKSVVGNGETAEVAAVSYVAAGIAGGALALTGLSALTAAGNPGAPASSPSFGEVIGWFQSMSMGGMLSVEYPPIYRSFTKNFAFSSGLIPWDQMQSAIDDFRKSTGGNLTRSSVEFLRNATLVFSGDEEEEEGKSAKRAIGSLMRYASLAVREVETSIDESTPEDKEPEEGSVNHVVDGFQAYVEKLAIPEANTFLTVLTIFAIIIATIALGILLGKVILETWALFSTFPAKLTNFRKHYWGLLARTITNLILVLYGIWTLYCVFQFTRGDSWAAKVLAGVTLAIFTATLGYFTFRIWSIARKYKKMDGDTSALYEDKETWRKYSLFYDHYKKGYWWIFVPLIVYLFVRGCIIAGADGNGMVQTGGQFIVEALMLGLLLWARPFETKSGQWINISIQVVRVLSVACIIVFVHELGLSQTTKTVTGIALIVVQSALTGILAILIIVNVFIHLFKKNPHEERQKKLNEEKFNRDLDNLTPLDARHSLLLNTRSNSNGQDEEVGRLNHLSRYEPYHDNPVKSKHGHTESADHLIPLADTSHNRQPSKDSDMSNNAYTEYDFRRQPY